MELSERKQKILAAIVETYIRTGEPVGSKSLMDVLPMKASSATIRNDMAELVSLGLLEQPHTSAGKVVIGGALVPHGQDALSGEEYPAGPIVELFSAGSKTDVHSSYPFITASGCCKMQHPQ